uniref:Putative secreted protein n=1 Tax=Ixodes ricinus TaxID=34613 RepID=V5HDJ2_IXORI
MFTLKFFILFVLAGLCFGDTSAGGTAGDSSGNEAPSGNQNGEQGTETRNDGTSDGKNNDEATVAKTFENAAGLPSWIKDKKSFLNDLLTLCHNQNPSERISNDTIDWNNCKYKCRHDTHQHDMKKNCPRIHLVDMEKDAKTVLVWKNLLLCQAAASHVTTNHTSAAKTHFQYLFFCH